MQTELDSDYPQLDIQIVGVNWAGLESANPEMVAGKTLPWLQDIDRDRNGQSDIWESWGTDHLDLVVLNGENALAAKANLGSYNLATPANYAGLRDALLEIALAEDHSGHSGHSPWQNHDNPLDVDGNGQVVPLDALLIINRLNSVGSQTLPTPSGNESPQPYIDTNGDGQLTPLDAILVINYLSGSALSTASEGEAPMLHRGLADGRSSGNSVFGNARFGTVPSGVRSRDSLATLSQDIEKQRHSEGQPSQTSWWDRTDRVFDDETIDWHDG